jgi:hypothetical protein
VAVISICAIIVFSVCERRMAAPVVSSRVATSGRGGCWSECNTSHTLAAGGGEAGCSP